MDANKIGFGACAMAAATIANKPDSKGSQKN